MQLLINLYCVGMICIDPFFSLFLMGLLKNNSRAPGRTGPVSWMYTCSHGPGPQILTLDIGPMRARSSWRDLTGPEFLNVTVSQLCDGAKFTRQS